MKKKKKKKKIAKFQMLKVHFDVYKQGKEMITTEVKLAFPDLSKPFNLYTDTSDIQLRATLDQVGKPLGFYTRKLNDSQVNYTVGEKESLTRHSVVTLWERKSYLGLWND